MLPIFFGIIIAISIIIRSFDGLVTNKRILNNIELFHRRVKKYVITILKSDFKTASIGILLSTFQYLIYFFIVILFLSTILFGISQKIGQINELFVGNQIIAVFITLILIVITKFGLQYNFSKFKSILKADLFNILKSNTTWLIVLLFYVIIGVVLVLFVEVSKKRYGVSNEDLLYQVIDNSSYYEIGLTLGFPIIIVLCLVVILGLQYIAFWGIARGMSYISYWLLKRVFSMCYYLNKQKPLKPILIFLQVSIIVITPCVSFAFKIFNN